MLFYANISTINSNLKVNDLDNIGQGGRELYLLTYNHVAIIQVGFWGIQTNIDTLIGVMPNVYKPKHTAWARNVYENQCGYAQLNADGKIYYKSDVGATSYFQATLVCLI